MMVNPAGAGQGYQIQATRWRELSLLCWSTVVHFQYEYFHYRSVSPKWYRNTYDGRYFLTRLWNVSPKNKKKVRNRKICVSVNPVIVVQVQLRLALADSLLERITKVIQTWLWVECYLVHYKNVSPRKECLKNKWKISNEDCHRVRLGQSMLDNTFPKRKLVKKETEMPFRKQQKTRIRSRVRLG